MHSLPSLGYEYDALEPFIDAATMQIHHGKHHQAYVDNLNKALAGHADLEALSAHDLVRQLAIVPEDIRTAARNNAGGHLNHSFFWPLLKKNEGAGPIGKSGEAIIATFGSFEAFKEKFAAAATGRFGSGWAWLVIKNGVLEIVSTPNQDSPVTDGYVPILALDVWEHAYYLKYQNRRAEYVSAFWNVVNWEKVEELYEKAKV